MGFSPRKQCGYSEDQAARNTAEIVYTAEKAKALSYLDACVPGFVNAKCPHRWCSYVRVCGWSGC